MKVFLELNKTKQKTQFKLNKKKSKEKASADASLLKKLLRSRLEENNSAVEVERKNPDSPLYSVKQFEDLNLKPELLKGLYAMGFTKPSKIQETALPAVLGDPPQNLIAQSQSGTGKTAAFSLAMLSRIDVEQNYPQVKMKKFLLKPNSFLNCFKNKITKGLVFSANNGTCSSNH